MRRANTTFLNLRATLDDLDPLVDDSKPVAKKLRPFLAELRPLARDARPTLPRPRRAARAARRGQRPDRADHAQAAAARRRGRRRQRQRQGARGRVPGLDQGARARPRRSSPTSGPTRADLLGWFDDFSHSGIYDALGAASRVGIHASAFALAQRPAHARSRRSCATRRSRPPRRSTSATAARAAASTSPSDGSRPVEADAGLQLRPDPGAPGQVDARAPRHRPPARRRRRGRRRRVVGAGRRTRRRPSYTVELDNAFGLVEGADLKVAGVRAGKITGMRVDREHASARWSTSRSPRTASARCARDVFCESRPQSLIGEYFIDCQPGTRRAEAEARRDDPGRADRVDDPARPRQQHPAPPVPRAPGDHPRRARRRRRRPRERHQRGRPPRQPGAARDRPRAGDPRRPEPDARAARRRRRRGHRRPRRQPQGRRPLRDETRADRRRLGRAPRRHRRRPAPPAGLPARAAADDGRARRRPPTRRRPRCATSTRPPASSRRFFENLRPFADASRRPACSRSPSASRDGRPAAARPRSPSIAELGRFADQARRSSRNNLAIVLERPRRPQARGREGPALARRQGLHRLRGAAAVRLRPVDGDQHLRRERLHAEGQPLPVASARTTRTRVAEGEAEPRTRPSTRTAPRSSARTSRASRSPTRRYTGAQATRAEHQPAGAPSRSSKRRRRQPANAQAAAKPTGPDRRAASRTERGASKARRRELRRAPRGRRSASSCPTLPGRPPSTRPRCRSRSRAPRRRRSPSRPPNAQAAPRLPARAMRRAAASRPTPCSSAPSRSLVDVVAVFLAYNANNGLPFVPTTTLKVRVRQRRQPGAGQRGALGRRPRRRRRRHAPGAARGRQGRRRARRSSSTRTHRRRAGRLDVADPPALGARPQVRRARRRARARTTFADGDTVPAAQADVPVELDEVYRMFDEPTRKAAQENLHGFGNAFAGRGASLNRTIEELPRAARAPRAGDAQPRRPGDRARRLLRRARRRRAHRRAGLRAARRAVHDDGRHVRGARPRRAGAQGDDRQDAADAATPAIESFRVQRPFLADLDRASAKDFSRRHRASCAARCRRSTARSRSACRCRSARPTLNEELAQDARPAARARRGARHRAGAARPRPRPSRRSTRSCASSAPT